MRVLVTGGVGYLGTVVSRTLLAKGHEVRAMDSLMQGAHGLVGLLGQTGYEFVAGDIRDEEAVSSALRDVDAVVHLAAIVGDPACAQSPELARETNLDSSLRLFAACDREGVERVVFASTCSNYGKMADPMSYVDEETELGPVSLYAETKVGVENALLGETDWGFSATVLRFSTLFGLSPRMRFDLTVNEFTMELATEGRLVVFGEQFWRPYVHVRDAAVAVAVVLDSETGQVGGEVYNVGDSQQNYQKGTLVELIREEIGAPTEVEHVDKQEDPRDYRVSFDKIGRDLGFEIENSVRDGIREIVTAVRHRVFDDPHDAMYRNIGDPNG